MGAAPVVVARVDTARGELVLRRDGERYEVISNGVFLMDTSDGRSERLLVSAGLAATDAQQARVLVAGLGVGFTLVAACAEPRVAQVTVVEIEPALVRWHRTHLRHLTAGALADPRVRVVTRDVVDWLATASERFDLICIDVDNGPHWTVTEQNAMLYGSPGTRRLASRLAPGGALAVWSAAAVPAYERVLREAFGRVETHQVEVARGEPDVVYVATEPQPRTGCLPCEESR